MEAYVDDILVKSHTVSNHIADLQETFDTLYRFQMRLNPAKCAFGVTAGKFFEFIISRKDIETNLEKIMAILEMTPSRTVGKVQCLIDRIASLNCFISRSVEKCLLFFQTLRQPKDFQQTIECQKVFKELKQYLSSPPLLMKPQPSEELLLYLAVSPVIIIVVLVQKERRIQKPIHCTSKVLHDAIIRYSKLKKLIFILVITYRPRPSIKAQVLVDFILKCIISNEQSSQDGEGSRADESSEAGESLRNEKADVGSDSEEVWMLYVDGSSNASGARAGPILTDPKGDVTGYTLRFEFLATNNEVEYEVLLAELKMAREAGAQHLKVFSDSQLMIGHIRGKYEAREENIKRYLHKVSKRKNARVDALSKLVALLPTDLEKGIYFEILKISSLEKPLVIQQVDKESYWIDPLLKYLQSVELLSDRRKAQKIRKQAARYILYNDKLYKQSFSLPLLKYLRPSKTDYALQEVYEGIYGSHLRGRSLSYKILRQEYY
uniref:Uncharacterized protein LOC105050574 n=1 Tax=Elaeis guineensis var. tenera TaxID=51953 RepID=A0A6I9RLZ5_ELAGV|nr:uncharacterized protein LOC105050574 [Elaeis guineensis]